MRKKVENLWDVLNDLEDLVKYGCRIDLRERYENRKKSSCGDFKVLNDSLEKVSQEVRGCRKCVLCEKRITPVPGEGVSDPAVLIIGEGPGADEDRSGSPFVGAAGQYLDKWLSAIGIFRDRNCFIGNIVKCRPPGNRDPEADEISACLPYLERQIEILRPKIILTLGRIAGRIITGEETGIGRMRGRIYSYNGIPVVPTYHPSAVLRDKSYRKPVWEDLQLLKNELDNGRK